MPSSMTGFGRAIFDAPFGRIIAEVQSINRKFLDISILLPKEFSRFELEIRKWVSERIARGQVSVRIYVIPNAASVVGLLPDPEILKNLKGGWERLSQQIGLNSGSIDLSFLLLHSPVQQKIAQAADSDLVSIEHCLREALSSLIEMKFDEGAALTTDFYQRIGLLEKYLQSIESFAPASVLRMKEKFHEKIKELGQPGGLDLEDRIAREVLFYAERLDVSEEIVRLKSHFSQFREICKTQEGSIGRKMDFLIQEIGREINTIGSKSADANISHLIVEMKSELEKIREQVQNIE